MALHIRNTVTIPFLAEKDGTTWDISGASTKQVFMLAPDGSVLLEKTALYVTDGSDGYCYYTTPITDITVEGNWMVELYIVKGAFTLDCDPITITFAGNIRGTLT